MKDLLQKPIILLLALILAALLAVVLVLVLSCSTGKGESRWSAGRCRLSRPVPA